jgi:DNA-binding phage protein
LRDEADISAYLEAAFEDGDAGVIAAALDDVARAYELLSSTTNGTERVSFHRSFDSDPRIKAGRDDGTGYISRHPLRPVEVALVKM